MFLLLLRHQIARAIVGIVGHTPPPLMPLMSGSELDTLQLEWSPTFAVKPDRQLSGVENKQKNNIRNGFSRGVQDQT